MGLDLYFSKAKALAAGMVLEQETNGSAEDIAHSVSLGDQENPEYLNWLKEVVNVTQVPGAKHRVNVWDGGEELSIRANKWGITYEPLTQWLKANNITWQEH